MIRTYIKKKIPKPSLFQRKDFIGHAGTNLSFKIECDSLTNEDIECIAYLISTKLTFSRVYGVPTGGLRLAKALQQYSTNLPTIFTKVLIVDDVFTTGRSMEVHRYATQYLHFGKAIGIVIFSRGICPSWITPIFQLTL